MNDVHLNDSRMNDLHTKKTPDLTSDPFSGRDVQAGITVGLVSIPQCMAFAAIAGLPPAHGLYAAVVMGLIGAWIASSPRLNIGPAVTTSSMILAVLITVAPHDAERWPVLAGQLAILVGCFTTMGAWLGIGRFVRFVSRSVLDGFTCGAAILIFTSQIAPLLGLASVRKPTVAGMLWNSFSDLQHFDPFALIFGAATFIAVLVGAWWKPRFPWAFVAIVASGVACWWLGETGLVITLKGLGEVPRAWPPAGNPLATLAPHTDLVVGAASIALVGIIQTLAIAKVLGVRSRRPVDPHRDLLAVGAANVAAGFASGFPGAGSFARSALTEMCGARSRWSGVISAATVVVVAALVAPLTRYVPQAAIAGLLLATAHAIVDWRELTQILVRDRHDRIILTVMLVCVLFLPIHWALLIGMALSVAGFLSRVSHIQLVEMVAGPNGHYQEKPIDDSTGTSPITMLQLEGPLFFAHADELSDTMRRIFQRGPVATILRMRRTRQIDFSVIVALEEVTREYVNAGGHLIICGLTPSMRRTLLASALARVIPRSQFLRTTGEVFGSAHQAIQLAERILEGRNDDGRERNNGKKRAM